METAVPIKLNALAQIIFERNVASGYYKSEKNIGEMLALIHSEVSEALEADREDKYSVGASRNIHVINGWVKDSDFLEHYQQAIKGTFDEEMADIIIRVLDLCGFKGIDIAGHIHAKLRYTSIKGRNKKKSY